MIVGISSGKNSWAEDRYPEGSHNLDNWTTEGTPLSILDIKGGETVTLYTMSANVSKVLITGYEKYCNKSKIVSYNNYNQHRIS